MTEVAVASTIIGTGLKVVGGLKQAKEEQRAADERAQAQEEQARLDARTLEERADDLDRQALILAGQTELNINAGRLMAFRAKEARRDIFKQRRAARVTAFAKAGVTRVGTPVEVEAATAARLKKAEIAEAQDLLFEEQTILHAAEIDKETLKMGAKRARRGAKETRVFGAMAAGTSRRVGGERARTARLGAVGDILTGGTQLARISETKGGQKLFKNIFGEG